MKFPGKPYTNLTIGNCTSVTNKEGTDGGPHHHMKVNNANHHSQKVENSKSRLNFHKITDQDKSWHLSWITT